MQVSTPDFAVWLTTFLGFLFFGIDVGLALGVGLSQIILFARSSSALCTEVTMEADESLYPEQKLRDADLVEKQAGPLSGATTFSSKKKGHNATTQASLTLKKIW